MKWIVGLALAGALASAWSAEPAMFRADARHSGVFTQPAVPELHGVKWRFRTGGPIISSPAVADGVVYFGSGDHNVYAVDAHTGKLRWKFATNGRVNSSPAVSDERVYVGSYDGSFYALDAASGRLAWKFTTQGERRFSARHLHGAEPAAEVMPDPFDVFLSSPVIAAGVVYFGSGDGSVYALAADSGALRWRFQTGNVVHASPAVEAGVVYVGSWDSYFYALDAQTGAQRWRYKTGEDTAINNQVGVQSSAVVANGIVYFGCRDSHLYALDALSGTERWAFATGTSWVVSSPAVRDGVVYFATSDTATVQAVDAITGKPRYSLSFNHWPFFSSPALAGDFLYIGSHAGKLIAINTRQHTVAWTLATDGARQNAAALTNAQGAPDYEAVYGDFFYDDMVSGAKRMFSVGSVVSSPVVAGETVFFGSWDGQLYAVG
jgi:eukaryotic-like serine/threonine-protein kinase